MLDTNARDSPTAVSSAVEAPSGWRVVLVAVVLGMSWVLFALPVWKSTRIKDPLDGFFTDHLRYRYCAALTVASPLQALRMPLATLHAEDHSLHRVLTWEQWPCNQPGLVFLAVHVPVQWLLDAEHISEIQATNLYVLFLLLVVHVAIGRLLLSPFWWAGVLVYPFLLRCALNGLQEPIPFSLALLGAFRWTAGRRLSALALVTLAFSAYSRWVVWLIGLTWLCWRDRRALLQQLHGIRLPGMVAIGAFFVIFAWSLVGNLLVASAWVPPEGQFSAAAILILSAYGVCLLVQWCRERTSWFAPVVLAALAFLVTYRGGIPYWYMATLLPAVVLARGRVEQWLWFVAPVAFPAFVFRVAPWPPVAELLRNGWLR
jgi:hypothetical protein